MTTTTATTETTKTTTTTKIVVERPPKEKAVWAMAQVGVDISDPPTYHVKSYQEVVPSILLHHWSFVGQNNCKEDSVVDHRMGDRWTSNLTVLCWVLEGASREMVMAFMGIPRDRSFDAAFDNGDNDDDSIILDNLVVLCYSPDFIVKQHLLGLRASTFE